LFRSIVRSSPAGLAESGSGTYPPHKCIKANKPGKSNPEGTKSASFMPIMATKGAIRRDLNAVK
jgi:hypothetical protein